MSEVKEFVSEYRTERMDQDSTKNKNSFFKLINEFEDQKFQILVGTQMLGKGLDFKNVDLVGIVNADNLIYCSYDFRSQGKMFSINSTGSRQGW